MGKKLGAVSFVQILAPELNATAAERVKGMVALRAVSYTHLDVYKRQVSLHDEPFSPLLGQ